MQRTIEWGNVAKRGKRMVNPGEREASEKLTPQLNLWMAGRRKFNRMEMGHVWYP